MFASIDELYQRIADAIVEAIPEPWIDATIQAIFYEDSISFEGDFQTTEGKLRSFETPKAATQTLRELRRQFRESGHPVFGQARFHLQSDGMFNMTWGYHNCDEKGDTIWDEEAWRQRHEERRLRMNRLG